MSLGGKHELCADTFSSADRRRRRRQGDSVLSAETEMDARIADVGGNLSRPTTASPYSTGTVFGQRRDRVKRTFKRLRQHTVFGHAW